MSWFSGSKYPEFQEKIEKSTSESIPNGDIDFATALEVSDLIRSKQVPAKEAMRILKKRFLEAANLNQQKSAFKLIDFCIKNGGNHFILELSSKEFMDSIVVFLKNKSINESLKTYILENVQTWSIMVSTNPQFEYINKTYKKLQDDGFQFPFVSDFIDPNLIESKVAPEWEDSDACMLCSKLFTFLNRKHHCRSCGGVFCGQHSSNMIEVPELGINIPVRVCDNCYEDEKAKKKARRHSKKSTSANTSKQILELDDVDDDDDDDVKAAIEMSLRDSATRNLVASQVNPTKRGDFSKNTLPDDEEEEKLMKAAIAASLQDMKISNVEDVREPQLADKTTGLYSNILDEPAYSYNTENTNPEYVQPGVTQYAQKTPALPHYIQATSNQLQQENQLDSRLGSGNYQQNQPLQSQNLRQIYNSDRITGIDERKLIDFVAGVDKQKSSQYLDPTLIKLNSDMVVLHSKVTKSILDETQEIEKYHSLFSKVTAISKLYDEILQLRLQQEKEMLQAQQTAITRQFYLHSQSLTMPLPQPTSIDTGVPSHVTNAILPSHPTNGHQFLNQQGYPLQPHYTSQYMSPQSTFGSGVPQVHQLRASIAQPVPQHTGIPAIQKSQPQVAQMSSVTPAISLDMNIPGSYAEIPKFDEFQEDSALTEGDANINPGENDIEPANVTKGEQTDEEQRDEIVNLIDL